MRRLVETRCLDFGWRRRLARTAERLHRDERGYTMLDYVMVFAFIAIPLSLLLDKLFQIITMYFSMIALYVTWPFL
jgi:hypothetical protein